MAYIEGVARKEVILFPNVIDECIKDDNPVQFIDVFVDSLDLAKFGFKHTEPEPRGILIRVTFLMKGLDKSGGEMRLAVPSHKEDTKNSRVKRVNYPIEDKNG